MITEHTGERSDPFRPIILEGPHDRSDRSRYTKLLRWDGSTFAVIVRRYVQASYGDPVTIEELDPPSDLRRAVFTARAEQREWEESLDELDQQEIA